MMNVNLLPAAWAGLEALRGDVERTLRRSCRDANEVDDLVQETFIRAARFRGSLHDPERLRSWLLRIAWNVLRDHIRRERRQRTVEVGETFLVEVEGRELPPGDQGTQPMVVGRSYVEREDLGELLAQLLPNLRHDERALLDAYYAEGRGCVGTGDHFGMSPEQVKMRLYRIRNRLRRELTRKSGMGRVAVGTCQEVVA